MPKPGLSRLPEGPADPANAAHTGSRPVFFAERGGFKDTPTFARAHLHAGVRLTGPALVEEYASTTVVPPGAPLAVDGFGNLLIEVTP